MCLHILSCPNPADAGTQSFNKQLASLFGPPGPPSVLTRADCLARVARDLIHFPPHVAHARTVHAQPTQTLHSMRAVRRSAGGGGGDGRANTPTTAHARFVSHGGGEAIKPLFERVPSSPTHPRNVIVIIITSSNLASAAAATTKPQK